MLLKTDHILGLYVLVREDVYEFDLVRACVSVY